jgi:aspartyl-tRNA synthetase
MGNNRLCMFMMNQVNIKDVLFFPMIRPERFEEAPLPPISRQAGTPEKG